MATANLAENIISSRQYGGDLAKALAAHADARQIVLDAYDFPQMHTEATKQLAIQQFKNEVLHDCLTGNR